MVWIMELKINGKWRPIRPTNGNVYTFETKEEARRMLNICYPDQCREQRLGGEITVRVSEVK